MQKQVLISIPKVFPVCSDMTVKQDLSTTAGFQMRGKDLLEMTINVLHSRKSNFLSVRAGDARVFRDKYFDKRSLK